MFSKAYSLNIGRLTVQSVTITKPPCVKLTQPDCGNVRLFPCEWSAYIVGLLYESRSPS